MMGGTAPYDFFGLADYYKKGVGNGDFHYYVAGYCHKLPHVDNIYGQNTFVMVPIWMVLIGLLSYYILPFYSVLSICKLRRKIPVQYANRQGKSDSNIPMKINSASVIPVSLKQS